MCRFSRKVEFSAVPESSPPADGEESNDGLVRRTVYMSDI